MEALKTVRQNADGTDCVEFFGGFKHLIILRGTWITEPNEGTMVRVDGIKYRTDKMLLSGGEQARHGEPCKLFLIESSDGMLKVAADARTRAYILGSNGDTIETIY